MFTPGALSGLNAVMNVAQFVVRLATDVMKAAGVAAAAPCDRTAPVADVSKRLADRLPVANAAVEAAPVAPDVIMKAPETES